MLAVASGRLAASELERRYGISPDEFHDWQQRSTQACAQRRGDAIERSKHDRADHNQLASSSSMPTIMTHGFVAGLLGKSFAAGRMPLLIWILSVLCSILPDADVIGFSFGVRYEDMLGHRGLSHSLVFALAVSLAVTFLAFSQCPPRWTRLGLLSYFFAVTASHGVLDAMTDGGLGVAFFSPFDETRYFFPFRPISVSPIGLSFFSARGLDVLWSELLWVWLPGTIMIGAALLFRKLRRPHVDLKPNIEDASTMSHPL